MSFAPPLFTALIERLAKAHNARVERRMSVQVTGLADTVRRAKAAIDAASGAASRLESSANAVVNTIGAVDDMTKQLDAANADLQAAVGVMTNGGPPLVTSPTPGTASPPVASTAAPVVQPVSADIPTSLTAVANANAAAAVAAGDNFPKPPATPVVPPPIVTASTIAAANAANAAALAASPAPKA